MKEPIKNFLNNNLILLLVLSIILRILVVIFTPFLGDIVNTYKLGEGIFENAKIYSDQLPYPPPIYYYVAFIFYISKLTHIPFLYLYKLLPLLSDIAILILLYKHLKNKTTVLLYAYNPVIILVSSAFGKEEPYVILIVLLSYLSFAKRKLVSALLLSTSICIKAFPVLLVPSFIQKISSIKSKLLFFLLTTIPVSALVVPFLFINYDGISQNFLNYSGMADYGWGAIVKTISAIWSGNSINFSPFASNLHGILTVTKFLYLVVLGILFFVSSIKKNFLLLKLIIFIFLLFYIIHGGIGTNFLYWVFPFLLLYNAKVAFSYTFFSTFAVIGYLLTQFYHPVLRHISFVLFATPIYTNILYLISLLLFYGYLFYLFIYVWKNNSSDLNTYKQYIL